MYGDPDDSDGGQALADNSDGGQPLADDVVVSFDSRGQRNPTKFASGADQLLKGVRALEHLLSLNIMPDDFEMEDIAACDASEATTCEASSDIQDRIFGLMTRAVPAFADAQTADGEYALESQALHGQFLELLEGEMERALRSAGWDDFPYFQASLRDALTLGGGGSGAGGEEGLRVRRGEAALELLELMDAVTRFEQWADAMKRRGRELYELRASAESLE